MLRLGGKLFSFLSVPLDFMLGIGCSYFAADYSTDFSHFAIFYFPYVWKSLPVVTCHFSLQLI